MTISTSGLLSGNKIVPGDTHLHVDDVSLLRNPKSRDDKPLEAHSCTLMPLGCYGTQESECARTYAEEKVYVEEVQPELVEKEFQHCYRDEVSVQAEVSLK
ncbi:hypothetical protein NDU88_006010 [Pleurodeles waltl]|uniref:Uncharacterized protein n=1 Tax=Pleurodeles waltl TaxID=8319 RepID=A0AAV7TX79_PLEWA|nr:hypothetical protein NDU88_006010 [Pleurodeles waltl]